jgi:hypothetical protein
LKEIEHLRIAECVDNAMRNNREHDGAVRDHWRKGCRDPTRWSIVCERRGCMSWRGK